MLYYVVKSASAMLRFVKCVRLGDVLCALLEVAFCDVMYIVFWQAVYCFVVNCVLAGSKVASVLFIQTTTCSPSLGHPCYKLRAKRVYDKNINYIIFYHNMLHVTNMKYWFSSKYHPCQSSDQTRLRSPDQIALCVD